jgi:transcriptional regulator NrdR family protein
MTHIIKRGTREYESYSRDKLHASIVAVCRSVRASDGSAKTAATATCDAVDAWLERRPEVTSADIRRIAGRALKIHNPDAAYYYTQHKHIM